MPTDSSFTQDNRVGRLKTSLGKDKLLLLRMTCVDRLSEGFTIIVDAVSEEVQDMHSILGTNVTIEFNAEARPHVNRFFNGNLWEYTELESDEQGFHYRLTLRPETQFMTLNRRNRIFQQKSITDITGKLLIGAHSSKCSGTYNPYDYCVQYQESDFDFVSRLLEYEGIYYYYEQSDGAHEIVLIDDRNSHVDLSLATVDVLPQAVGRDTAHIWSVIERRSVGPGKVTVSDYDFKTPAQKLDQSKAAVKILGKATDRSEGSSDGDPGSWGADAELYDFPAKFNSTETSVAQRYSQVWLDAHRRQMARSFAEGTIFVAAPGKLVTLNFEGLTSEYLIIGTTHRYSSPAYHSSGGGDEEVTVELELMPAAEQYRPALKTPRPRILGPQTALVVGTAGEEIYTDEFGRIKVQFYWDREGAKDDKSSCWIRVVQTGAGQGWGSFTLPRMGQEVVVEFMDGDPDRPLVTGAVYNATNTTPMKLPDNKTQFGLKTRITKGGGGYNHYWMEDKKGEEVVWFRAERDYKALIVNADEEREYTKGNRTVLFKEGNDEKTLDKGNLTTTISKGDETRTITTGKRTTTIKADDALEVQSGDHTLEVGQGNRTATIKMGNDSLKVSMGNVSIKVDLGSHKTEAMQAIELKCGASSIKMDPASITLESVMIKIKGSAMVQTEATLVQSKADAMSILKGGIVMIN